METSDAHLNWVKETFTCDAVTPELRTSRPPKNSFLNDVLKQTETMNPSTEHGSTEKTDDAEERRNHLCGLRILKARSVCFIYRRMLKLIIANTTKFSTIHCTEQVELHSHRHERLI